MLRRIALLTAVLTLGTLTIAADPPATAPAAPSAPATPTNKILKYHDGRSDGKRSIGGSGQMIEFTMPEGYTKLTAISIFGARYGMPQPPDEDFTISILDEDRANTLYTETAPYKLFARGPEQWVTIRFKNPMRLTGKFWVCLNFNAEQTKGIYVSYDTSTGGQHSMVGLPGAEANPVDFKGDWMLQATVSRK